MLFSNKNQTSCEYYVKSLTKIKVISKTRCILHYLNNFNILFKYLYKQSRIFKTIYFHKKFCFSFIHILVLLRMFLPFCVYSSIFIVPFQIKFMIICSFYINREMRCLRNRIHINLFCTFIFTNSWWFASIIIQVGHKYCLISRYNVKRWKIQIILQNWAIIKHYSYLYLEKSVFQITFKLLLIEYNHLNIWLSILALSLTLNLLRMV